MTAHFLLEGIVVGRGFFFGLGRYRKKAGQEKEAAKKRCVVRTSLKADWCCTLHHHPQEGPRARPTELGAAPYLRWEVGVSEAVVEQVLHSFALNFAPQWWLMP